MNWRTLYHQATLMAVVLTLMFVWVWVIDAVMGLANG